MKMPPPKISRATSLPHDQAAGDLLRQELEALNQALKYRSTFTKFRSSIRRKASEAKCSQTSSPKPSFKVPFRSPSCTAQDRVKHAINKVSGSASSCKGRPLSPARHVVQPQHGQHQQVYQHPGRKGFWRWRPLRAISHMILGSHQRFHVLFSLHVHCIQGIPASLNGLRLLVRWICKGQGLQTIPTRILQGTAEFGETLELRCTLYGIYSAHTSTFRYDAKPCTLLVVAVDADGLELSKHEMDLSSLLPRNDACNNICKERCHIMNIELLGMAKGSTLTVSFNYDFVHSDASKSCNDVPPAVRKLKETPSMKESTSYTSEVESRLKDPSYIFSTTPESGIKGHSYHNINYLELDQGTTLFSSSLDTGANHESDFSISGMSNSFEFKSQLVHSPEDDEQASDFSFPQTVQDVDKAVSPKHNHCMEHEESKDLTWKPLDKSEDTLETGRLVPQLQGSHSLSHKGGLEADFDDEIKQVTEEFLKLLEFGFKSD